MSNRAKATTTSHVTQGKNRSTRAMVFSLDWRKDTTCVNDAALRCANHDRATKSPHRFRFRRWPLSGQTDMRLRCLRAPIWPKTSEDSLLPDISSAFSTPRQRSATRHPTGSISFTRSNANVEFHTRIPATMCSNGTAAKAKHLCESKPAPPSTHGHTR